MAALLLLLLRRLCRTPFCPAAELTEYLEGTDLGSLGPFFGANDPALVRCATPELFEYAWDYSGAPYSHDFYCTSLERPHGRISARSPGPRQPANACWPPSAPQMCLPVLHFTLSPISTRAAPKWLPRQVSEWLQTRVDMLGGPSGQLRGGGWRRLAGLAERAVAWGRCAGSSLLGKYAVFDFPACIVQGAPGPPASRTMAGTSPWSHSVACLSRATSRTSSTTWCSAPMSLIPTFGWPTGARALLWVRPWAWMAIL